MAEINHSIDPTLAALDVLHGQASGGKPRSYLGASAIGTPCSRALWYGFRHATTRSIPASGYRAIQDGHRGEAVMIAWLRSIPGIQLWTEDPDRPKQQIGFIALNGHFRGNLDGIIQGLYQAPQTPHVWEHKCVNETKYNKLVRLIQQLGEKNALKEWDEVYFAQSQTYMDQMELTRHYLTVTTPGNRAITSCRTAYQPKIAKAILKKAQDIIASDRPPLKLRDDPSFYLCKFCDHQDLCHGAAMPNVNCRTCAHSTARLDGPPWTCELNQPEILGNQAGCDHHAFHPDLLANHAEAVNANPQTGVITFLRKDGSKVMNGITGLKSTDWAQETRKATAQPVPDTLDSCGSDEVLSVLAADSAVPAESLLAGQVNEQEWPAIYQSGIKLFAKFAHDPEKTKRLRNLLEVIDSAYLALIEREAA